MGKPITPTLSTKKKLHTNKRVCFFYFKNNGLKGWTVFYSTFFSVIVGDSLNLKRENNEKDECSTYVCLSAIKEIKNEIAKML